MKISRLCLLLSAALGALGGCKPDASWHQDAGSVWGTTYRITYQGAPSLGDSIVAEMARVDASLSVFNPKSTVSRINAGHTDTVDEMFTEVFDCARKISEATDGAFDPTVMPLVALWGFGPDGAVESEPDSAAIAEALARVGIGRCYIEGQVLRKAHPETRFDFSAIAKGYGVDRIARLLERNGAENYIVEIGGEIVCGGKSPRGDLWRVQIDAPVRDEGAPRHVEMRIAELGAGSDRAVATSGNYRNWHRTASGKIVGHTIDPRTGRPVSRDVLSATVFAPTCMEADALATACMVAGRAAIDSIIGIFDSTRAIIAVPAKKIAQ